MNITLIALCVCGLLLHFLLRWWEAWRTKGRIGPIAYAMHELPMWLAAIVGAVICMIMLRNLPVLLGIPDSVALEAVLQVCALSAGYMGSSVAAKVMTLVSGKLSR